jgi:SAM-dependent methyltransferase
MHDTASICGDSFAELYGRPGMTVVDLGGLNVNGSLRNSFESRGMKYICVDLEPHPSVDLVVPPGSPLPFETASIDLIVSTSCFEHDPVFWMTFLEFCRIIKPTGYIYINAPANGVYHQCPGDNWRFYQDAAQALAYWSGKQPSFHVQVVETFHIAPLQDIWYDFVGIWQRIGVPETAIRLTPEQKAHVGILQDYLNRFKGLRCLHYTA